MARNNMRCELVISIADLPRQEGAQRHFEYEFTAPERLGIDLLGVPKGSAISAQITLQSVSEGVLVAGAVQTQAVGECARCAQEIKREISESFAQLVYYPQNVAALAAAGDEAAIDGDLMQLMDNHVNLEPIIRDAIILGMPLQPLCQPDCLGLCPECGERWADLPANHHHDYFDPRFAALDSLAQQLAANELLGSDQRSASVAANSAAKKGNTKAGGKIV